MRRRKSLPLAASGQRLRGVAALEMAVLLPLLAVLPAAAWEWGQVLAHHERLAHSVRSAVRHLATGDATDPVRQDEARRLAVYGRLNGGTVPVVPGLQTSMVQIRQPDTDAGLRMMATGAGTVSLVSVSIAGVRHEPILMPPSMAFTLRTVSMTMVLRFS